METKKKSDELALLEEIIPLYPEFPQGELRVFESPDFILEQKDKAIGIEITNYIRGQGERSGSLKRRDERIHDSITHRAKEIYLLSNEIPLHVSFFFLFKPLPAGFSHEDFAHQIVDVISQAIPKELFGSILIGWQDFPNSPIFHHLNSIHIIRVRNSSQQAWVVDGADFIEIDRLEISQIIASKEEKINYYKNNCSELWLIIIADAQYISSIGELPESVRSGTFRSRFDKILFFDRLAKNVTDLNIILPP